MTREEQRRRGYLAHINTLGREAVERRLKENSAARARAKSKHESILKRLENDRKILMSRLRVIVISEELNRRLGRG